MKHWTRKILETTVVLTALSGIILTLLSSGKTENFCELAAEMLRLLFFFTIDSSIFVLILFGFRILSGKYTGIISAHSVISGAVTINILVTGIVFFLLLRSFESQFGPLLYAGNMMLHYILPVLCFYYFMIYAKEEKISFAYIGYWIIFPSLYFLVTLVRGAITGKYPYPFLNANTLGYPKVLVNSLLILIFIIILSIAIILLNRLIHKIYLRYKPK